MGKSLIWYKLVPLAPRWPTARSTWTSSLITKASQRASWYRLLAQMPWKVVLKWKLLKKGIRQIVNELKVRCAGVRLNCPGWPSPVLRVNIWPREVMKIKSILVLLVAKTYKKCTDKYLLYPGKKKKVLSWRKTFLQTMMFFPADKYVGCNGEAGTSLLHLPIFVETIYPPDT